MRLGKVWESYEFYTAELSKSFRTLAISGAAICWLFKTEDFQFPFLILISLLFIASFFIMDIAQYFIAALRYKHFAEAQEKEMYNSDIPFNADTEIELPRRLDQNTFTLFCLKSGLIVFAYIFIMTEIITQIHCNFY